MLGIEGIWLRWLEDWEIGRMNRCKMQISLVSSCLIRIHCLHYNLPLSPHSFPSFTVASLPRSERSPWEPMMSEFINLPSSLTVVPVASVLCLPYPRHTSTVPHPIVLQWNRNWWYPDGWNRGARGWLHGDPLDWNVRCHSQIDVRLSINSDPTVPGYL